MKLNKQRYLDKLHGCWLGKNIGGTIGGPYEGQKDFLNIEGFITDKGEPLPNDDLDLQLVWLAAMEHRGVIDFDANTLAEYWLAWIVPDWNEYGIAKTNLRLGLLPPMSGEVDNDKWKTSNGAWIRSEVWAGLAPGMPDVATKYACMDATVDHGLSEGTAAEIFTAALESAAYIESDIIKLIELALSKISEQTMVSKTVRLVLEEYKKGTPYKEVRDKIIEFNSELGWFQAPANLGYVVIGLLYGEGNVKKSIIYAVNCGDDTDCTGATVGAVLGIIYGASGLPQDWCDHIGDKIVTISINCMYRAFIPQTCTQLTERVAALMPEVMRINQISFEFTDGEDEISQNETKGYMFINDINYFARSPYSFDYTLSHIVNARVELDKSPRISPLETRKVKITLSSKIHIRQTRKLFLKLFTPQGWSADGLPATVTLEYLQSLADVDGKSTFSFTLNSPAQIDAVNRIYLEITSPSFAKPLMLPITLIG